MTLAKFKLYYFLIGLLFGLSVNAQETHIVLKDARLRSKPAGNSRIILTLRAGDELTLLDSSNKSWFYVSYLGTKGFVSRKLITETPAFQIPIQSSSFTEEPKSRMGQNILILVFIVGFVVLISSLEQNRTSKSDRVVNDLPVVPSKSVSYIPKPIQSPQVTTVNYSRKNPLPDMESNNEILKDESIIDVTGKGETISPIRLNKYPLGVPFWQHQYVYSYTDINSASHLQRQFYTVFKDKFLKGEYLDLEGNSNYVFILLFDLLNEHYETHNDLALLAKQLNLLDKHYPITARYTTKFFKQKMDYLGKSKGGHTGQNEYIDRVEEDNNFYWGQGSRYKDTLNLSHEEVKILNSFLFPNNTFINVPAFRLEIIKFFRQLMTKLGDSYAQQGKSIDEEIDYLAGVVIKARYGYKTGSSNFRAFLYDSKGEVYEYLLKWAENAVREKYGHKRKLNIAAPFQHKAVQSAFSLGIDQHLNELVPALMNSISEPDREAELELNSQNTTRWKTRFDEIEEKYISNPAKFKEEILLLGELNTRNPSIENIFYEASKSIAKINREISLSFYVYYLYYDLKSASFDKKELTKSIQKALFKNNEQLHEFEAIMAGLFNNRDLNDALARVKKLCSAKRKKIQLDSNAIEQALVKHKETLNILNKYLKDDFEDEIRVIHSQQINNEEIVMAIVSKDIPKPSIFYVPELNLSEIQYEVLDLFIKNSYSLKVSILEDFCRNKGMFSNRIVESINESCFEFLDDVLIELEDEEYYVINSAYYKMLLKENV